MNIFRRFSLINFPRKITMKKSIFDIQLVNWPMLGYINAKNSTNGGKFDNWAKDIVNFKTWKLTKSLSYKVTFVAIKIASAIKLVMIKPTKTNDVSRGRRSNKILIMVGSEDKHLSVHGSFPVGIT